MLCCGSRGQTRTMIYGSTSLPLMHSVRPNVLHPSVYRFLHTVILTKWILFDKSFPSGYVQASKRDKKFATCAPNFSYAALGECLRRVFIYRQPSPVDTVLFNRKQGRQVGQVAKQQVANLDTNNPVLGFRASNERLFILTASNMFVLKVNNWSFQYSWRIIWPFYLDCSILRPEFNLYRSVLKCYCHTSGSSCYEISIVVCLFVSSCLYM